jgi:cystathionine beta-lyase/cystathionine gamma-synthase
MGVGDMVTGLLGKRCTGTVLLARPAFEALRASWNPVEVLSFDGSEVFDIRAWRAAHPGTVLAVDNSHAGPRISPACMRGADVVFDDLSMFGQDAAGAVSWSRDLSEDDRLRILAVAAECAPETVVSARLESDAEKFMELDRARDDLAKVAVAYLACHPSVKDVVYAGAGELAARARKVFEHGFGNRVRIELFDPSHARKVCDRFSDSAASGSVQVLEGNRLLYLAGSGDPFAEIDSFEDSLLFR